MQCPHLLIIRLEAFIGGLPEEFVIVPSIDVNALHARDVISYLTRLPDTLKL